MKELKWIAVLLLLTIGPSAYADVVGPIGTELKICVDTSATPDKVVGVNASACTGTEAKLYFKGHSDKVFGSTPYDKVTKAIISIHGGGSHPGSAYQPIDNVIDDLDPNGEGLNKSIWLVAPQFIRKETESSTYEDGVLRWPSAYGETWGEGNDSQYPTTVAVSSYEIVDGIIRAIEKQAPNLTEVVVVGFSRGGRFVNRYSIGTKIDNGTTALKNSHQKLVAFRYLAGGQAGYIYLNSKRYSSDEFGIPVQWNDSTPTPPANVPDSCTKAIYDSYPFGLDNVPAGHYMSFYTKAQLKSLAVSKRRLFLVGNDDIDTDDPQWGCGEWAQGWHRRERAHSYLHHLRVEGAAANTGFCVIKGVGHSPELVLGSYAGRFYWLNNSIDCSLDDGLSHDSY